MEKLNNHSTSLQLFSTIGVLILSVSYSIYTDSIGFGAFLCLIFFAGLLFLNRKYRDNWAPSQVFSLMFLIYGLLVLLSHIELIHDLDSDFYVHNDAADAFYPNIVNYVVGSSWSNLADNTILNPFFSNYPFAAYLFGVWIKIGEWFGITDVRLLLRCQSFVIGVIINTIVACALVNSGHNETSARNKTLILGIFTYLYITSAIFTRDIHVCLVYTILGYVFLKNKVTARWFWFALFTIMAFGFRPANGALALFFPAMYYFKNLKGHIGNGVYIVYAILMISLFYYANSYIASGLDSVESYQEYNGQVSVGGLFSKFYFLPDPLRVLCMFVYDMMMPVPLYMFITGIGGTWLNLPMVVSPYIMVVVFGCVCYYLFKSNARNNVYYCIVASLLCIFLTLYATPTLRRVFAAIPSLYMCYAISLTEIPTPFILKIKRVAWPLIFIVVASLTIYTMNR